MRYTRAEERRAEVERILAEEGYASSTEVAERLGVSTMTIRRDLQQLEESGRAQRVAGGATIAIRGLPFERRSGAEAAQKRRLAAMAAAEIGDAAMVALDAGTTVAGIAPLLEDATIVTHSLPVITAVAGRVGTLVALGGLFQPDTRAFAGPMAEQAALEVHCDIAVLSATGVTGDALWGTNALDASLKRVLASIADRVLVVADGTKLGARAPLRICETELVDLLLTDDRADPAVCDALRARGIDVRIAR
ncbi:DeoR/GlpR family DNA-binding transcription regulator [Agromyces mediolanus]|uniref:DeoR/GlpR family DNA-binding transcription regulator n=1 Tax=Agromyces mediolanus TaxID=41986 RepID=UPI00203C4997|nr:DeoR/GlpR family DNA-binding transcription regulator [Agromyces mediolanus]MCM3658260.1 DeoR/GlpR family DNA-binding transcription regulator [Agromyces mediolanus]